MRRFLNLLWLSLVALGCWFPVERIAAQGTAFTYQGFLDNAGVPANGLFGVSVTLYPNSSGGVPLAGPVTNPAVLFTNGLFTTLVDFGPGVFTGSSNWLEIAVQTNVGGPFILLPPRQQVTPEPYALYASVAASAGSVAATNVTGTFQLNQLPAGVLTNQASAVTLAGSFAGNGAGLTNVNLLNVNAAGAITWATNVGYTNYFFRLTATAPLPVGNFPEAVAVVDVNGDGYPDLVGVNAGSATLTVLTNNGAAGFGFAAAPPVGNEPFAVAVADVNGDGKPDLISANYADNTLTILTNNGAGNFGSNATLKVGSAPIAVVAADVNGDGQPDLIAANQLDNTLTILTNNGFGAFGSNATLHVGLSPVAVAVADVNSDGYPDLIAANSGDNTLTVLTNNGLGRFVLSATLPVGNYPDSVVAADVNGDGQPDLIAANYNDDTLTIWTNQGAGRFGSNATFTVDAGPASVVAVDVNLDGWVDLVSASKLAGALTVLTNNQTGGFVVAARPGTGGHPDSVVAADLNGDGKKDLVSANESGDSLTVITNASTVLALPTSTTPTVTFTGDFTGSAAGLTNVPIGAIIGGLTTTLPVLVPGGHTNTLVFQNGILIRVQ